MEEKVKIRKNREKGLSLLFRGIIYILLFALGLALSGYLSLVFFQAYLEAGTVTLPDFRHQSLIEAVNASARLGLQVEVKKLEYDPEVAPNAVIEQDPAPGSKVKKNSRVWLVVNGGEGFATTQGGSSANIVVVPDVREKTLEEAEQILQASGFQLGRVVEASHERVPQGYVISQNPPPQSKIAQGAVVSLLVSKGGLTSAKQTVVVPDLVGLRLNEAKAVLAQEGLSVGDVEEVQTSQRRAGIVIDQEPLAGEEVEVGKKVNLRVSRGTQETDEASTLSGAKELSLRFSLPDSRVPIEVKVVANDELGERVLYEKTHQGGDLVEFSAVTKGKGKVVIFLNGYYYWEKTLE